MFCYKIRHYRMNKHIATMPFDLYHKQDPYISLENIWTNNSDSLFHFHLCTLLRISRLLQGINTMTISNIFTFQFLLKKINGFQLHRSNRLRTLCLAHTQLHSSELWQTINISCVFFPKNPQFLYSDRERKKS